MSQLGFASPVLSAALVLGAAAFAKGVGQDRKHRQHRCSCIWSEMRSAVGSSGDSGVTHARQT